MDQRKSDEHFGDTLVNPQMPRRPSLSASSKRTQSEGKSAAGITSAGNKETVTRPASPQEDPSVHTTRPRTTTLQPAVFDVENAGDIQTDCEYQGHYANSYSAVDILALSEGHSHAADVTCQSEPPTPCQAPVPSTAQNTAMEEPAPAITKTVSNSMLPSGQVSRFPPSAHVSTKAIFPAVEPVREDATYSKLQRRTRAASVPTVMHASGPTRPPRKSAKKQNQSHTAYSHHQLLTLHQLHQPRPYLASQASARSISAYKRTLNRFAQGAVIQANSLSVPKLSPPITRSTLRELDLREILRNPQLRHDIVFDPNLVFRPNFDGERGRKKLENSERYWTAVDREIVSGCRCTAFDSQGQVVDCICGSTPSGIQAIAPTHSLTVEGDTQTYQKSKLSERLPSRIPGLVSELRNILLSLLPSPSDDNSTLSVEYDVSVHHHQIMCALDPEMVAQQVEHQVLDLTDLAGFLGRTLKMHCAPMRDDLVDAMVEALYIEDGDCSTISHGLQLAFDILELMKLDIANHQLRTLRPYLLETAIEFEMRSCQEYLGRKTTSAFTKSQSWLSKHRSTTAKSTAQTAFVDLIFHPDGRDYAALTQRLSQSRRFRASASPAASRIPETLQLDLHRIQNIHTNAVDLAVVYVLLMLFQQVASKYRPLTDSEIEAMRLEIWALLQTGGLVRFSSASLEQSTPLASNAVGWKRLDCPSWRDGLNDILLQMAAQAKAIETGDDVLNVMPDEGTLDLMEAWVDSNLRPTSALFRLFYGRLQSVVASSVSSALESPSNAWWLQPSLHPEPSIPTVINTGACSRSARIPDLLGKTPLSTNATSIKRSREEDDSLDIHPRKKAKGDLFYTPESSSRAGPNEAASLLRKSGLAPLTAEVASLSDKIAKFLAFHLAVYDKLYEQLYTHAILPN